MRLRALFLGLFLASGLSSCGLPSNPQTPPEVLVTALGSTTSSGEARGFAIPFGNDPGFISSQPLPADLTLWGAAVADSTLILLARTGSGGEFLLSPLPLSPAGPVTVTGLTGIPYALALSGQVVVVLETTSSFPEGCLQTFSVGSLISLSPTGGSVTPLSSCQGLPGNQKTLQGGMLLPMADGVEFLVGALYASSGAMDLLLYPLSTVIDGASLSSPQTTWTTAGSYNGGTPLSGVALSSLFLLPDPTSPAVDLYQVTTLYNGGGGTLEPLSRTSLSLPAPPTLLSVDPAQNFLMAGSSGSVSLFGLGAVLSPPGTLGALGDIPALSGLSLGALAIYTGSS